MKAEAKSTAGFTLIETLAALAIASAIIVSTGVLMHQSVFFFDRGTRAVDQSEQLALAINSLAHDFGAARFVLQKTASGLEAAFSEAPAGQSSASEVVFVTGAGLHGEEVVSIAVELGDGFSQIVRRRAAWPGPRLLLRDAHLEDPVILLKGPFEASFSFSELTEDDQLVWHGDWDGKNGLPHSVRLNLRDSTGAAILTGAIFPIRADAPATCAGGEKECLSIATNANPASKSRDPQPNPRGAQ
ncbi:prepilin-type N-terminal cleavage/methylation domain-containing protein [Methyloferula stellata]|uniref:prepilin-type N-terminal cleavage/methylation domain-containing protein n=1 Tax=Methyloferula stellata TaxID=876270 RepID=UPI00037D0276|nr:prepilin-type N-terminal cleavage/methylation domain-containing protein [Methyloferula stellata]